MKQFLLGVAFLLIGLSCGTCADAQVSQYQVSNPCIVASGNYVQPAYTWLTKPCYIGFPWYSPMDTVTVNRKGYKDSAAEKLQGFENGVYTWCHANTYSGTNPTVYRLWASADSGKGVDFVQVYSVSVAYNAANPVANYTFNGNVGWQYTNWFWDMQAGTGDSVLWYSGVNVR